MQENSSDRHTLKIWPTSSLYNCCRLLWMNDGQQQASIYVKNNFYKIVLRNGTNSIQSYIVTSEQWCATVLVWSKNRRYIFEV